MTPPTPTHLYSAVILKPNRLYADTLRLLALRELPHVRIDLTASIAGTTAVLEQRPIDLLLVGTEALPDGDMLDFIALVLRRHTSTRILVIAVQCENRTLVALRSLPIHGVFDASNETPAEFAVALDRITKGASYWSHMLLERLRQFQTTSSVFRLLTRAEQLVLSTIGDGCDDVDAAARLGLSPGTISSVRRNLHRKLGVRHRGELVRIAAQNGFVRFSSHGIERPGYSLLTASHQRRSARSTELLAV